MILIKKYKKALIAYIKSFYLADKYLYIRSLRCYLKNSSDFILIYTMGKVGSTSIYKSLKNVYPNENIYHLHRLNSTYLEQREKMVKSKVYGNKSYPRHLTTELLWKPIWIKNIIKKNRFKNLKVITVIREPISRNISLFFQWIEFEESANTYSFKSRNDRYPFNIITPKDNLTKLYDIFLNVFSRDSHLEWLKSELLNVFQVDIYNIRFDKRKGYTQLKKDKLNLLVLKLESLNESFNPAMNDFFGNEVVLILANDALHKNINRVYEDFKNNLKLPLEYVNSIYESDFMKQFYTELEIQSYKNRWLKN